MQGPGQVIRKARIAAGLSQAELAKRVGTNQSAVSFIERGRRIPDVAIVARIADAVGAPRREFLARIADAVADRPAVTEQAQDAPSLGAR